MLVRKSIAAILLLVCMTLLYLVPTLLNPAIMTLFIILGSLLVLEERSAYRLAYLSIGLLTFATIFIARVSPFYWLTELGTNFAIATIVTVALPFILTLTVVYLPRFIARQIERKR